MKALILVEDDTIANLVSFYLKPLGLDIIRYRDPLKALDNLDEVVPDAIIMSARDFPRHWKTIVVGVRSSRPKAACAIILLKGEFFPFEEAAKAAYLGVNGVVKEDLSDRSELARFQQLLKRYMSLDDARVSDRLVPGPWDRLDFVFSHPTNFTPVTGRIETISSSGISFVPESPALVADIEPGTAIDDASLRVDRTIMAFGCKVVRVGSAMAFSFESIGEDKRLVISDYLAARSEREIRALLKS